MSMNQLTNNQGALALRPLQEREHLLNEYSEAVHSYQSVVLELTEARERSVSDSLLSLLSKADDAKQALNYWRDRYQKYCALNGAAHG